MTAAVVPLLIPPPLLPLSGSSVHSPVGRGLGITLGIDDSRQGVNITPHPEDGRHVRGGLLG